MKKYLFLFLSLLLLGAAAQDTGWVTRSDCTTLPNPQTLGTICLNTAGGGSLTQGHFYRWNGASWDDVTGGGAGAGTVTNTGTLTANQVIIGNAGVDVKALGSLGTTTQVLHGNASGAPSFGSVVNGDIANSSIDLTAKVTGVLPRGNGSRCDAYVAPGTNVIQAAIDALPLTGGTVCLGTGTYTQTTGLTLGDGNASTVATRLGIQIEGVAPDVPNLVGDITTTSPTIISCSGVTNCITLNGTQGWMLHDLDIQGDNTASSIGLLVNSSAFGIANNLRFSGFVTGIDSTTWNAPSRINHDSWGNKYSNITIFMGTSGLYGFKLENGDNVSNTDFNRWERIVIFPVVGATACSYFKYTDNNAVIDFNCISTDSKGTPLAPLVPSVVFDYTLGSGHVPQANYFNGFEPGLHVVSTSGTVLTTVPPNYIFGLSTANGAACPNIAGVQVIGCTSRGIARVTHNTTQTVTNDSAWHALAFNTDINNLSGFHSTSVNNSRITFSQGGNCVVMADMNGSITTGTLLGTIWVNGTGTGTPISPVTETDLNGTVQTNTIRSFATGDYIEFALLNSTGGAETVNSSSEHSPIFSAICQ